MCFFGISASFHLSYMHCVIRTGICKMGVLPSGILSQTVDLQNGGTSLWNFVPNCGLFIFKNIHYGTLIVAATCFIPY